MIKDQNGESILKLVVLKVLEQHPEMQDFKARFSPCQEAIKSTFDDLKNAVTKAKNEVNVYKNQFDLVIKVDPDVEDIPFGKQIKKCFEEA